MLLLLLLLLRVVLWLLLLLLLECGRKVPRSLARLGAGGMKEE